jgi:hypothetical protein
VTEGHLPDKPSWKCRGCGSDWPCKDAWDALKDPRRQNHADVAVYMCTQLGEAAKDLVHLHPDVLYRRFIAPTFRPPLDAA